jgi:hypothetical protein
MLGTLRAWKQRVALGVERALADEVRMVRGCREVGKEDEEEDEERKGEGAVEDVSKREEEEEGRGCR